MTQCVVSVAGRPPGRWLKKAVQGLGEMTGKLSVGTSVRVKQGVTAPDVPEVDVAGWTGTITQVKKSKNGPQCFVEWHAATVDAMPAEDLQICQDRMLYHLMACFSNDDLEILP